MNRANPWQSRRPSAASASGHRQSISSQHESAPDSTTTLSAALGLSLTASEHLASHITDKQLAKEALSLTMLLKGAEQIAKSFDSRQKKLVDRLREAQSTIEALRSELVQSNDAVAEAQAAAAAVTALQSSAHIKVTAAECQTDLAGSVISSDVQTQLQARIAATVAEQQQLQQTADALAQQLAWEQQQRALAGSVLDAARQQEEQAAVTVREAQAQCELKIDSYKRTNARLAQVIDRLEEIVLSQQKCIQRGRHHTAATATASGENRAPSSGESPNSSRQRDSRRSTQQQQQQQQCSQQQ
eukprot:14987-Heterococcus_DN1.PRE.4